MTRERASWARVRALIGVELLALARDRAASVLVLVALVLTGVLGSIGVMTERALTSLERSDESDPVAWDCQPGVMAKVAFAGDPPSWLSWPDAPVDAAEAGVLMRFATGADGLAQVDIVELDAKARTGPVRDCVDARVAEERRARLTALGVSEELGDVVAVETLPPDPAGNPPLTPSPVGMALLGGLALLLTSVFLELGPRARATGWLETWMALPGQRGDLVLAWWLVGVMSGSVAVALVLVGDRIGTLATGLSTGTPPWALLPAAVAVFSAVGVRVYLDVPDMRTAMVRTAPVLLVGTVLVAVARLVEMQHAGLGGIVPIGGLALAMIDEGEGGWLAMATAVAAGAWLVGDAVRALEEIEVRADALGREALRRAHGDYLPEAALLVAVAVAGMGAWGLPDFAGGDPAVRTALSLFLFVLLPAWLAPVPLRLDRRELLSLRPPPWRAWLAVPFMVPGTVAMGLLLWRFATWAFPDREMISALTEALGGLDSPLGLVAVSVVPGACEELLFRGAVLGLLRKRYPAWGAVVLQAAAFACLHGLAVRVPHTFGLGLVFGLLVVRTGSVWPAVVAHAAHNLVSTQIPEAWATSPWLYALAPLALGAAWGAGWRPRETGEVGEKAA